MSKKPSKPPGRPSSYSDNLSQTICDRLAAGESLRKICESPEMPDRSTVMSWQATNQEFSARCARAREWQADLMDDLILDTANECTSETAAAARVKISAYQWRAAKLAPKRYGERVAHEHRGAVGTYDLEQLSKLPLDDLRKIRDILGPAALSIADRPGDSPEGS